MAEPAALLARLLPAVALIVGSLLLLRRWSRHAAPASEALRIVARSGLTRNAVVAVVAVGTRRFLVGASDSGIRLLGELDPVVDDRSHGTGTDPVATAGPRTGLLDRARDRTVRVAGHRAGHVVRR